MRFDRVRKTYALYATPGQRALDALGVYRLVPGMRPDIPRFDALSDVSFTIRRGERVGIVGRNGAGKTTLLKLVTGNFAPSSGSIARNGAVHSLMQTGIGFSNEMTGRQNIRAGLASNGVAGQRLEEMVADIIDFCELGAHIDQPLKTYSLGMAARLQFATATAIDPDVLVIDEVLGAGDVYFLHKSAARVRRFATTGTTLLIVSHAMQQILEFCERVIWLDRGRIVMDGPALEVVDAYEVYLERLSRRGISSDDPQSRVEPPATADEVRTTLGDGRSVYRWPGKPGLQIDGLRIENAGRPAVTFSPTQPMRIGLTLLATVSGAFLCRYLVTFWTGTGRRVARVENEADRFTLPAGGRREVWFETPAFLLGHGRYFVSFSVYDIAASGSSASLQDRYDVLAHAITLDVAEVDEGLGYLVQHPVTLFRSAQTEGGPLPNETR
ncbi:MAG: ABC transporter ATP-binding protein [Alsobacter sp.]